MVSYALKDITEANLDTLIENQAEDYHKLCGECISSYRVLRFIAHSYIGAVYQCQHLEMPEVQVAMKCLRLNQNATPEIIARFKNEFKCLESLRHRSVVRAYKFFKSAEYLAYSMEYVSGDTLADRLARQASLSHEEALKIFKEIVAAVGAVHDKGIIHRDIKPEHILFDSDGRLILGGFSIARFEDAPRLTLDGGLLGTVAYLSPEYIERGEISKQSDIYALGILAHELFNSKTPYHDLNVVDTLNSKLEKPMASLVELKPGFPLELSQIIQKATAKDPLLRHSEVKELIQELQNLASPQKNIPLASESPAKGDTSLETVSESPNVADSRVGIERLMTVSQAIRIKRRSRTQMVLLASLFAAIGALSVPLFLSLSQSHTKPAAEKTTISAAKFVLPAAAPVKVEDFAFASSIPMPIKLVPTLKVLNAVRNVVVIGFEHLSPHVTQLTQFITNLPNSHTATIKNESANTELKIIAAAAQESQNSVSNIEPISVSSAKEDLGPRNIEKNILNTPAKRKKFATPPALTPKALSSAEIQSASPEPTTQIVVPSIAADSRPDSQINNASASKVAETPAQSDQQSKLPKSLPVFRRWR